ncbi:MAG TPA: hypothetical protein DCS63_03700 [Elusimicrobia bacterium]|nr:hypothetical protein [Elusimicrobiota bacterium]
MSELLQKISAVYTRYFLRRAVVFLAFLALVLNVSVSWKVYRGEPLREAASRSLLAFGSSYFYDSGLAEPLPVFALKLAMAAGADPDAALRAEGLAVFALLAFVTFFTLRRRFGEMAAGMATLFLAANPYAGYYAMQGSSHLYALVFLALFWHYFDSSGGARRDALLAGLYGGLACLSRLDAALALLVIAALSWAVKRGAFRLKDAGLSLGLALLLALPYAACQKAKYNNSLYAQELSLRRWANIESYGYAPAAYAQTGPLGPAAFLFRNGAPAAVWGIVRGLGRALSRELPRALYYKFLFVLVFLGAYAAFALKNYPPLFFLAAALLPALPLAIIKQVPATGGIELRYYLWPMWALCVLAGLGFQEILEWTEAAVSSWGPAKRGAAKRSEIK